jgi:nitrite reductase/ring-hydroxylating ferredoxin subunit
MTELTTQERFKRGAADADKYFQYMSEFAGLAPEDAETIRETRFIIEKHIPAIIGGFYAQLLRFPATRKHFLKPDGAVDQEYLEMRMQHQANFWRRVASGQFDEDFARFTDYVGRAHTSHGADPKVYIPQRYVIGMIGFMQRGIADALSAELQEYDPELAHKGTRAWNALLTVILEMLTRPYVNEGGADAESIGPTIEDDKIMQLAVESYERGLGMARSIDLREVRVAAADEIPDGQRKIVDAEGVSIGVIHQDGKWYALRNSCLHRGGPVCEGELQDGTLTCPWHGYQYELSTGELLLDRSAHLDAYKVSVRDGQVHVIIPVLFRDGPGVKLHESTGVTPVAAMKENEFRLADLAPGHVHQLKLDGKAIAVYNVDGAYYATDDDCSHARGPLSQGHLEGMNIVCPWHDSCFNVATGAATCPPARKPVKTYRVETDGEVGRVVPPDA